MIGPIPGQTTKPNLLIRKVELEIVVLNLVICHQPRPAWLDPGMEARTLRPAKIVESKCLTTAQ